ncbi:MAG: hypothetical protein WCK67_00900 [bacterium]
MLNIKNHNNLPVLTNTKKNPIKAEVKTIEFDKNSKFQSIDEDKSLFSSGY